MVEFLCGQGADIKAQGGGYGSALQAALIQGRLKVVEFLCDQEADMDAQD